MRTSRYGEDQIIDILKESEGMVPTRELYQRRGIAKVCFCRRNCKFVELELSEARRLRQLEAPRPRPPSPLRRKPHGANKNRRESYCHWTNDGEQVRLARTVGCVLEMCSEIYMCLLMSASGGSRCRTRIDLPARMMYSAPNLGVASMPSNWKIC